MSDGVPKSRVTLVYDTKQPEGREKPRELPFRLLVLGDVGGDKSAPLDHRKVRQLNGRNLGEVIKGLKVEVRDIDLGDLPAGAASTASTGTASASTTSTASASTASATSGTATPSNTTSTGTASAATANPRPKAKVLIDSMSSFSPDEVLKLLTGQKATATSVDPMLAGAWGTDKTPKDLWPGDAALTKSWEDREQVVGFQKSYQNSKTLRAALKRFSAPPADAAETQARKTAIAKMKQEVASAIAAAPKPTH